MLKLFEKVERNLTEGERERIRAIVAGAIRLKTLDLSLDEKIMSLNDWDLWRIRNNKALVIEDGHVTGWEDKAKVWHK